MNPKPDDALHDVGKAVDAVGLYVHSFVLHNQTALGACTGADVTALTVRAALTYLVSNSLVVVSPDGAFDQWLSIELEEPYASDLAVRVAEALAKADRYAAAAAQGARDVADRSLVAAREKDARVWRDEEVVSGEL